MNMKPDNLYQLPLSIRHRTYYPAISGFVREKLWVASVISNFLSCLRTDPEQLCRGPSFTCSATPFDIIDKSLLQRIFDSCLEAF